MGTTERFRRRFPLNDSAGSALAKVRGARRPNSVGYALQVCLDEWEAQALARNLTHEVLVLGYLYKDEASVEQMTEGLGLNALEIRAAIGRLRNGYGDRPKMNIIRVSPGIYRLDEGAWKGQYD